MNGYIIALDQGTTSSRSIIFDSKGNIVSLAQYPFTQIYPKPGWVEHDPMVILESQMLAMSEAFRKERPVADGHRRHRHHEPARDDDRLGQGHRRARL